MARYPIKQLKDKNELPFFPFNTLESVLVDGTDKNLADVLNDIYTKNEVNAMFAIELSKFSVYPTVSDLPATARSGAVAAVNNDNTYIMYMYYDGAWRTLTQKGDTGPYFTPSVDASGNISWTNNGGLPNPTTKNIKGPQGIQGETGPAGADATINGVNTLSIEAGDNITIEQSGSTLTISADDGTIDYTDLENKPKINNVELSGNKTTSDLGLFSGNYNDLTNKPDLSGFITKDVNNLTNYTLATATGSTIDLSINSSTYVVTLTLKNAAGTTISTDTIDLPLESVVVSGNYDDTTKKIILTLQNGSTIEFSVADLVSGLQTEITNNNKLSADLVDDTSTTNKFVSSSDKTAWNAKYDLPNGGIPSTDLASAVQTSLGKADTAIQSSDLATVATTGDYTDLTNTPTIPDEIELTAFDVLDLPNTVFNFTNAERGIYKLDRVNTFYGKVDGFSTHQLTGMDAFELAIIKKYSDASTNENFARLYGYSTASSLPTFVGAPVVYYVKKESGGDIGFYQSSNGTGSTVTLTDGAQTLRGVKTFNDIPVVSSYTAPTSNTQLAAKKYVDDSVSGKQNTIDSSHKLDADLVDDTNSTNKFFSGSYNDLSNKPTIPDELADLSDDSTHRVVTDTEKSTWSGKQDALVSGINIKTVNSTSILGSGDISVQPTLVSGTNIKTINNTSLLGSGNIEVSASYDLISEEEIDELFDGPTPPPTPAVTIDLRTFASHWGSTWSTNDAELATELSGIWSAQQDTSAEMIISNNASVEGTLTGFDGSSSNKTMNLLAQPGFSILIAGTDYIQVTQAG